MSNNPFDRTILNPLEKPLADDLNQAQSQLDRTRRGLQYFQNLRRTSNAGNAPVGVANDGFYGDGFKVYAFGGMTVAVQSGTGFMFLPADVPAAIGGIVGLDDLSPYKPLQLVLPTTFTVPAAPGAGLSRFDIIEAKPYRRAENPLSRDVLDPATGAFTPQLINKTLAWSHDGVGNQGYVVSPASSTLALSYKQGVAGAPGAVPATTAGYTRLAIIYVNTGTVAITEGMIRDTRKMLSPNGILNIGYRFDYKTGANPHTNLDFVAPPGVRGSVVHDPPITYFYAIMEGVRGVSVNVTSPAFGAVTPVCPSPYGVDPAHPFDATDISILANAAKASPVLVPYADIVVGPQQCVYGAILFYEWDVGTQQFVALAHNVDDMSINLTCLL